MSRTEQEILAEARAVNADVLRITVTQELPQVRALIEARLGT